MIGSNNPHINAFFIPSIKECNNFLINLAQHKMIPSLPFHFAISQPIASSLHYVVDFLPHQWYISFEVGQHRLGDQDNRAGGLVSYLEMPDNPQWRLSLEGGVK